MTCSKFTFAGGLHDSVQAMWWVGTRVGGGGAGDAGGRDPGVMGAKSLRGKWGWEPGYPRRWELGEVGKKLQHCKIFATAKARRGRNHKEAGNRECMVLKAGGGPPTPPFPNCT